MHTLVSIGRFLYRCYYQRRKQEKGQRPILNQQERAHKYQFSVSTSSKMNRFFLLDFQFFFLYKNKFEKNPIQLMSIMYLRYV